MKVAVLSDIHGNLPALEAVAAHIEQWAPDITVVNGDVVNRGPRPRACWEFVQVQQEAAGWRLVRGNHEQFVAKWLDPERPRSGVLFEMYLASFWTYRLLGPLARLIPSLPAQEQLVGPAGGEVRITHGSMRGDRDGIYPETAAAELAQQIKPAPAVFCTAHTHRPLVRQLNGTLVINSGSAGTTFDGDVRASYAQLTWRQGRWHGRIVRLPYDRDQTARDFVESGFLEEGGALVRIFFEEWQQARPMVNQWAQRYEAGVVAGEIGLAASVDAFLGVTADGPGSDPNGNRAG